MSRAVELPELMLRDRARFQRRLDGLRTIKDPVRKEQSRERLQGEIERAHERVLRRRAGVPKIVFPPQLPVSQKRDEIAEAIRDNQVVIVAGETGSGKTTQIPKICLELGRGIDGLIGHTQPRRLAARTVGARIAEELGSSLGEVVGYKVRFTDQSSNKTYIKLMTDGILLAEIQNDRKLLQYDTIIIDEAHERSLNIDFLLGYLKTLLPRRPDLKVIITSATIETERFSAHFNNAPVIEVSGRTFPVETRYRPVITDDGDPDRDEVTAICDAVEELQHEGGGDVLVFLSGEREIRDTADAMRGRVRGGTEVVPLYARLSAAEQHKVFEQHTSRRVVLATNVAETSLTVPGIRYVVDPGTARISRYSSRLKVQRLPIEDISQASANQRKGRCGRLSDGICIRLYSEDDFANRPEYTEPEILRTNLASVILRMTALELGDIAAFPFIDPPDSRQIKDGLALLHELGAVTDRKLTKLGKKLAALPLDPRLGRMVLEAERNGCVREVLIITAALSIQDPRERPADKQQASDEQHKRFRDENSDFLSYLNLWNYVRSAQKEKSSSAFRRMCRTEYLHYLRIREWQDLRGQLQTIVGDLGISINTEPADETKIHISLLSGLLSQIGAKEGDKREYLGARGGKFAIFPGSALFAKQPKFVMAAELVETSRLWARVVARIEPEWAEPLAQHLVKRNYSEPHWEAKRAGVVAFERVTLYGVPIVARRKIDFARIDPELSRDLFIRHALVEGDWQTHHAFFEANRELLAEVGDLEDKVRTRGLAVDDQVLYDFYDARIPPDVVSGRHFDAWWKKTRTSAPDLLTYSPAMLLAESDELAADDYPETWNHNGLQLPLTYSFTPGSDDDGVTVHIPISLLNQVDSADFDWLVPGYRLELYTELIRSLPKALRTNFVPAPNWAENLMAVLTPRETPLFTALERELLRLSGHVRVPVDAWDLSKLQPYLRMRFSIEDDQGKPIAVDRDLDYLKRSLAPQLQKAISAASGGIERSGLTGWDFGELPRTVTRNGVLGYPALVDEGATAGIRVVSSAREQKELMPIGTRRLILLNVTSPAKVLSDRLPTSQKLYLASSPHGSIQALIDDCVACAADSLIAVAGGPAWEQVSFDRLREAVRRNLGDVTLAILREVQEVLAAAAEADKAIDTVKAPAAVADLRAQLSRLLYPGFITDAGRMRIADIRRYLNAITVRVDKLHKDLARDQRVQADVQHVESEYRAFVSELPEELQDSDQVKAIRWMCEELRLSLFAQLKTSTPISDKRIFKAMEQIVAS